MGDVRAIASDLGPRLEAAREEVAERRKQLQLALDRRDQLMAQAKTEGMNQRTIAQLAGVKPPHVTRVLANAEPDLLLPS